MGPIARMVCAQRKLGQYIRGWTGYFGISQYYQSVPKLDEWIRWRIRMCCWKPQFQ